MTTNGPSRTSLLEVDVTPGEIEKQRAREARMTLEEAVNNARPESLTDQVLLAVTLIPHGEFDSQMLCNFARPILFAEAGIKQVTDTLGKLVKAGHVNRVSRGMYSYVKGSTMDRSDYVETPLVARLREEIPAAAPTALTREESHPTFDGVGEFARRAREARLTRRAPAEETRPVERSAPEVAVNRRNPRGLVATSKKDETTGATVWWQLSGSVEVEKLVAAFEKEGLDPKLLVSAEASPEILIHRIAKKEGGVGHIVRKHPKGGWSVVRREKHTVDEVGADKDSWVADSRRGIRIFFTTDPVCADVEPPSIGEWPNFAQVRARVRDTFTKARNEFDAKDISKWVTRFVSVTLKGVSLRWNGGMYFIPNTAVAQYEAVERAFRAATSHALYEMPTLSSESTLRAIVDAVRREATEEITKIEQEFAADEIGPQARAARLGELSEVLEKVTSYEKLFGCKFGDTCANITRVIKVASEKQSRGALLEVD